MRSKTYRNDKLWYWILISLLAVFLVVTNLSTTMAVDKPLAMEQQVKKPQDNNSKKSDDQTISDDDVKLWLKQIEIYGQIAKPQTVFIIPGTDPRVDGLRIDRHFFSHIFRPVEKSTLRRIRIQQGKDKDHVLW